MKLVISAHVAGLIFHANILKLSNTSRCNRAAAGEDNFEKNTTTYYVNNTFLNFLKRT